MFKILAVSNARLLSRGSDGATGGMVVGPSQYTVRDAAVGGVVGTEEERRMKRSSWAENGDSALVVEFAQ